MKTFYGATFLAATELAKCNVYNPMKLEYYKIRQMKQKENKRYGIEIVKKMYKNKHVKIEKEKLLRITSSEEKVEKILEILKKYQVTPIILKDVIEDLEEQFVF